MSTLDAAVVAGFEGLPRVDLGHARREERRRVQSRSRRRLGALAALLIFGSGLLVPATRQIVDLRAQVGDADQQLAAVSAQWQRASRTADRADARIDIWARYEKSREGRRAWDDALPALAAALPAGVSLQRAQITASDSDAAFAAAGTAETTGDLRAFLGALGASPQFARIRLDETTANAVVGPRGIDFKISGPLAELPSSEARL